MPTRANFLDIVVETQACARPILSKSIGNPSLPCSQKVFRQMMRAVCNNTIEIKRGLGCFSGIITAGNCSEFGNSDPDMAEFFAALASSSDP
jgi:hypothetical protein